VKNLVSRFQLRLHPLAIYIKITPTAMARLYAVSVKVQWQGSGLATP